MLKCVLVLLTALPQQLSIEMKKVLPGHDSVGVALSEYAVKSFGIGKYMAQMMLMPLSLRITFMAWE